MPAEVDDSLENDTVSVYKEATPKIWSGCLYKTCLHPRLSLKNQLFLSFGVVSTVSLLFVMIVSIVTARKSGDHVKNLSRANLEQWSEEKLGVSVRIFAETIAKEIESLESLPAVMAETAKDRFVGYPDHPGYADDSLVPFRDMVSGMNVYPLTASAPLPLDWTFEPMKLTDENAQEHVQDRKEWYINDEISTATATIRMQGSCDPFETDLTAKRFYPNCTDAHNNLTTGGVVAPTSTMDLIHKKSSDFAGAVLKPLYEANRNSKIIGFYLANSGAGAVIAYPALVTDSTTSYVSIGCDWMLEPNPINKSMTIGTEEEIARCHPAGTLVFTREYNPLEREWCKIQALDPSKSSMYGPYKDAFSHDLWLLTFGRAIYDRVTSVFIGCTLVDVSVGQVSRVLRNFSISNTSEIAFVNWDEEGTVVASERWNTSEAEATTSISALGIMDVSKLLFAEMKNRFTSSYHSQAEYSPVFVAVGKVFACYPVPVPPKVYDISYEPAFAVILSVDAAEIFGTVNDLDDAVEEDVRELIRTILIAGFAGIAVVILCIYVVSLYLTRPMEWMNDVGDQIVQSLGSHDKDINFEPSAWLRYTPRTEIKLLMQQFHKTVERFSGQGTAKLHTHKGVEVKNSFVLGDIFQSLYLRRGTPTFKYNYEENGNKHDRINSIRDSKMTNRMHWGLNFHSADGGTTQICSLHQELELANGNKNILASPLFWWILGAITIPLVMTMIVISVYVTWSISNKLPTLVVAVEDAYVAFERRSLYPLAKARSDFAASVMTPSFRDIHMLSRIAGWVFFGGIQKAKSITAMTTGAEDCKNASRDDLASCPYSLNRSNTPCDCKWNQKKQSATWSCTVYEEDSRYLQQLWWYGSNLDTWPNGDINSTSYPEVATSPGNTSWWSDWNTVPGFELGFDAANSATTYEDLLSLSALSMVQIPLFNYQSDGLSEGTIGTYLAFEDNGIFSGYSGCDYVHAFASQFLLDEKSAAFEINPELCQLGKYGYDPRCRSWYLGGQLTNAEGKDPLYVTPPYIFAGDGYIGQSMSLPLQEDGDYLGQALLDFDVVPILDALTQEETPLNGNGFHALIATTRHNFGTGDTVVGPDFDIEEDLQQGSKHEIEQSVLPYDVCESGVDLGCANLLAFRNIYEDMRAGLSGSTTFTRTTASAGSEIVYWAYSPVKMFSFSPFSNSNFSQGVANYHTTIFSVALAETEQGVYDAFNSVEVELDRTVKIATTVLSAMIVLALLSVVFMSARMTVSIIFPVYRLLHLVTSINKQELNDGNIPEIHGGSCEITKVHDTFERLYMVVRFANTAFFSGDLEKAYETLQNALALFIKLHDDKAIGVANNNLGNTMLTMYRTMKKTRTPCICGLTQAEVIANGNNYFKNTIDRGEEALAHISKEEGWSTNYLVFMQQLSNRYFNRAIFLLTTKEDHPNPDEAEMQGFTDLSTSKDMDREVVDNGDDRGFKGDRDVYFELLIGRIKGILHIVNMGYTDEWGVDELIEDARKELVGALREPGNILFRSIEPAGQMQRFDAALIQHYLNENENEKAALIAIRMLIEDDYVIAEAAIWAIKALNDYVPKLKAEDLGGEDPSDVQSSLFQYRQRVAEMMSTSTSQSNIGKGGRDIMMRESAKQSGYGDVSMELF